MTDLRSPNEHRAEAFAACEEVARSYPGASPDELIALLDAMLAERGVTAGFDARSRVRALLWSNQASMVVRARRADRGEPLCAFGYSCPREARAVARGHALVNLCAHHEVAP